MFTSTIAAALLVAAASAAPTSTTGSKIPSRTYHLTGVTHTVAAGRGALSFEPNNIVAEVGDIVEWHYAPMNHSVAQSSFDKPCKPLTDAYGSEVGFFSGFNFNVTSGQSANVFQIVVEDKKPIWFYCSQTKGDHCQKGMTGVINQNFDSLTNTLAKYNEQAKLSGTSVSPAVQQPVWGVIPNPQPLAGF